MDRLEKFEQALATILKEKSLQKHKSHKNYIDNLQEIKNKIEIRQQLYISKHQFYFLLYNHLKFFLWTHDHFPVLLYRIIKNMGVFLKKN